MDDIFRLWRHSSGAGCRNPDETEFDDLEGRDLLDAGGAGYRYGRTVLHLGLQAGLKPASAQHDGAAPEDGSPDG
jgi:hypothetical protein